MEVEVQAVPEAPLSDTTDIPKRAKRARGGKSTSTVVPPALEVEAVLAVMPESPAAVVSVVKARTRKGAKKVSIVEPQEEAAQSSSVVSESTRVTRTRKGRGKAAQAVVVTEEGEDHRATGHCNHSSGAQRPDGMWTRWRGWRRCSPPRFSPLLFLDLEEGPGPSKLLGTGKKGGLLRWRKPRRRTRTAAQEVLVAASPAPAVADMEVEHVNVLKAAPVSRTRKGRSRQPRDAVEVVVEEEKVEEFAPTLPARTRKGNRQRVEDVAASPAVVEEAKASRAQRGGRRAQPLVVEEVKEVTAPSRGKRKAPSEVQEAAIEESLVVKRGSRKPKAPEVVTAADSAPAPVPTGRVTRSRARV